MINWQVLAVSILLIVVCTTGYDFLVYVMKSGPRSTYYSRRMLIIGFVSAILLVYYHLNGMKFF